MFWVANTNLKYFVFLDTKGFDQKELDIAMGNRNKYNFKSDAKFGTSHAYSEDVIHQHHYVKNFEQYILIHFFENIFRRMEIVIMQVQVSFSSVNKSEN